MKEMSLMEMDNLLKKIKTRNISIEEDISSENIDNKLDELLKISDEILSENKKENNISFEDKALAGINI